MISPDRRRSFFLRTKDSVFSMPDDHDIDEGTNVWFFKFIIMKTVSISNYVEKKFT